VLLAPLFSARARAARAASDSLARPTRWYRSARRRRAIVWRIDLPGGFVSSESHRLATKALEHLRGIDIAGQWPGSACEGFVGFVNLAQAAIRQSEIIEYALVVGRQFWQRASNDRPQPDSYRSGKKRTRGCPECRISSIFTARSNESLARSAKPSCQTQLRETVSLVNFASSETARLNSEIGFIVITVETNTGARFQVLTR